MKLPMYDNSPPPGTPLYSTPADSEGDWPIVNGLLWAGVGIAGLAAILYNTVDAFRSLF